MGALRNLARSRSSLAGAALLLVAVATVWRASTGSTHLASQVVAAMVGVLLFSTLRRRLDLLISATAVLAVLLPLLPSLLLRVGLPLAAVRPYGYLKDLATLVVLSCLLDPEKRRSGPLDAVERWGLAFVGLITLYLVLPLASSGTDALPFLNRASGWRFDLGWVLFLLAVRRLRLPPGTATLLIRCLTVITALEVASCLYQKLRPASWNSFLNDTLQVSRYLTTALGTGDPLVTDINHFGTGQALRVGGLTVSPLSTGFILTVLIALLAPYALATRTSTRRLILLGGSLLSLSLTLTRSAVLSTMVVLGFVFFQRVTPRLTRRTRALLLVLLGALVALPSLLNSSLVHRTTAALAGADPSADAHSKNSSAALDLALHHLLGFGLGTNPNIANRFRVVTITAESTFLQTSLEVGVLGLLLFSGFLISLIRSNLSTHQALGGSLLHLSAAAATAGLVVQSLFLEPFSDLSMIFMFAALMGVAQPSKGLEEPSYPPLSIAAR